MSIEPPSDEDLVRRAQAAPSGDLRAFETLVNRHQRRVLTNCRHLTRSDDAEDLAQEVFVKAFFALRRFEGRSRFGTWIGRIKVNHCLNHLRKRKDRVFVDVDDPATAAAPELVVEPDVARRVAGEAGRERVREILERLPATLRVPLILRDLDELSYQEIAEELGIGLSAVKMRIKRGREMFRRLWAEEPGAVEAGSDHG